MGDIKLGDVGRQHVQPLQSSDSSVHIELDVLDDNSAESRRRRSIRRPDKLESLSFSHRCIR